MPNLLRPARWPLNAQNAAMAVVILTITTLAAGLVASSQGENALLDHEIVDLNDEANLRAKEFQRQVTRFAIELRQRAAAPEAVKSVGDGALLAGLRELWSPNSKSAEATGTRLDSAAVEPPFLYPGAPGGAPAGLGQWLSECLSKPAAKFHALAEVSPFVAGPDGKGPCRVYLAAPLPPAPGQSGRRLVVAPLNVTNYLVNEARHSPRHLYYLVGGDPTAPAYLHHPDPALIGTAFAERPFAEWGGRGGRRAFPAGELYSSANRPALDRGEAVNVADPSPAQGAHPREATVYANPRPGKPEPGFVHATKRLATVPRYSASKMAAVWERCKAFNDAMAKRAAKGLRYSELQPEELPARDGQPDRAVPEPTYVQLTHADEAELRGAAAEAERLLGEWFRKDLGLLDRALPGVGYTKYGWLPEVVNDQVIASFTLLETGVQDDYPRAPRLVVTASVAEIKQDVWIETFPDLALWVLVSILAGGVIAVLMTWYVTRPLRHIKHAARALAEQAKSRASGEDGGPHGSATHLTLGTLPTGGPPEVSSLSASLVNMLGEIEHLASRFRQRNAEFESILKDAPDGIVLLTANGELVRDNAKFKRLFGHGVAARLAGTSIRQYLKGADDSSEAIPIPVGSSFSDAQGGREFWTHRRVLLKGVRADGQEFPADCTFTPIELDGSYQSHYTGIIRDFTERAQEMKRKVELEIDKQRELEKLVAERTTSLKLANQAKDLFMANVSHELRAPLTVISGDTQMLLRSKPAPEVERRVRRIYESMNYLTALVNDILDSMKIIEGKLDLNPREFDFPAFVEKVAAEMRPRIEEGKNSFAVHCPPEVGAVCQDDVRLKQVLYNLIGNAAKFTREGSIKVECWRGGGPDGDLVRVAVTDSGRGLSPEELVKVQNPQPFGKLKDRERNREGTGLGLVICKGLCEKMGGALHVASEGLGRGATFTALFASHIDEASAGTDSTPPRPVPQQPARSAVVNRRILVVDDEPSNRELAEARLGELGFQVHVASSDIDTIQQVSHVKPAAILLDIVLRDSLNGWAILKALKEDPGTRGIPVIIVSVLDEPAKARESGADDYVVKPVGDWDDMAKRIRRLLPAGSAPATAPAQGGAR